MHKCPSEYYYNEIQSKNDMVRLNMHQNIKHTSPLHKDFYRPLFKLLNEWNKDIKVCNACKNSIKKARHFERSQSILLSIQYSAKSELTTPSEQIQLLHQAIKEEIENVRDNAFCKEQTIFIVK